MPDPWNRIYRAWCESGVSMGKFFENACFLAGLTILHVSDAELADACEKYAKWRKETRQDKRLWST